ncbi:hypothetical protein MMC14_000800 [Varicellaria rhodocarpa]|nr:hypothetical protein [Varicellaria rhodocarpa]
MTQAIVAAIQYFNQNELQEELIKDAKNADIIMMENPAVGKPIVHAQVIALSRCLRNHFQTRTKQATFTSNVPLVYHLDALLRGSRVYVEAPKPKPERTSEYKALMARLRTEEEARSYERMINPPLPVQSFAQRFPNSSHSKLFDGGKVSKEEEDDEVTYADINRQMALILNILISIVACSVALWIAARHWTTPKRLGLSMGGSGMIGVAEVVVYAGYLRRIKEAKEKGKKHVEVKEIIKTWVIGGGTGVSVSDETELIKEPEKEGNAARRRKPQYHGSNKSLP